LLCMLIVNRDSIAHDVLLVPLTTKPLHILLDLSIIFDNRLFQSGVRIFKAEDEFALVHLRIVMREKHSTKRPDMENKVGIRGKPGYDLGILVRVWKRSQTLSIWQSSNQSFLR